jgi:hypothetical protein
MKKHYQQNKYDKQRKYYDNPKPIQHKENVATVSNSVAIDENSIQNTNSGTTQISNNNSNATFVPQEKFLINVSLISNFHNIFKFHSKSDRKYYRKSIRYK